MNWGYGEPIGFDIHYSYSGLPQLEIKTQWQNLFTTNTNP